MSPKPIISKAQVKDIDDALYKLSLISQPLDVLDATGVDTTDRRAYAEDIKRNLLAYKSYAVGEMP